MKTQLRFVALFALVCSFGFLAAQAQPVNPIPQCTVGAISPEQARLLTREAQLAFQLKKASNTLTTSITYVPIRPHIMRRTNGTGQFELNKLNQAMALTNGYFMRNGSGIQFYFAGATPDYIDNDEWYANPNNVPMDSYDATNAMNQYYFGNGAGGFAYYPANGLFSTRSIIYAAGSDAYTGNYLIPHELGHNFNLYHTFGPNNGTAITDELVTRGSGANCSYAADLICDTPADPYGMSGVIINYVNGCPEYSPSSTARDPNGQTYSPLTNNIMSYYASTCRNSDFTVGQRQRMQEGLALRQSHTAYTLDAPPTNVTAPSNLTATLDGLTVVLTWQDNATNEMGYFVERASANSANFIAIGGVAPNGTTFTDLDVTPGGQYTYRIRPSNTTTGSLSQPAIIEIVPPVVDGLTTSSITGNAALLNWNSLGTGVAYDLRWRQQNSPTWNTLTNLTGNNYFLSGLTTNTSFEWQVKGSAGSIYPAPASFTTTCPTPQFPTNTATRSAAWLYWSAAAGQQYTLQWRQQGTPSWSVIENIPTGSYQLTNLTSATPYNWRVSATCPGTTTLTTDYTPVQSFTTVTCPTPSLYTNGYTSTSLQLYWNTTFNEPGRTYAIRYRPLSTPTWTTLTGIPTTTYSLTGLITNVAYEVQVQSVCSETDGSSFSSSLTATATCPQVNYAYSYPSATTTRVDWYTSYFPEAGATFELQYRPINTTSWTTITVPTAGVNTTYYTHLLTGLLSGTTYQYRIRTVCPGNNPSNDSQTYTFTTGCFTPSSLYTSQLTSTNVTLGWFVSTDPDALFDLRYRSVGANTWTTISSLTAVRTSPTSSNYVYSLTGLTNNITYEWQVRTICSSAASSSSYVSGNVFTTSCPTPYTNYSPSRTTSVQLNWANMGTGLTYDFRYRRMGNTEWTYSSSVSETTYLLTGLPTNTMFEWQVRSRCSDGAYAAYSSQSTFSTYACSQPLSLYTTNRTGTGAVLNWSFYNGEPTMNFEVRYRVTNTGSWTTVSSSLTTTYASYSLAINGLAPDTQYEWQARTLCSATESSVFTSSNLFSTCSAMYTLQNGFWNDSYIWSCGRIPNATDPVQLRHTVTVLSNYTANARQVNYTPGVQFILNGNARFILGPQP